jgi:AMP-polyphosphate phosphotransferase
MLENVDLTKKIGKKEWKAQKTFLQDQLYNVAKSCFDSKIAVTIVLEGWDGSGKGVCIKHLTERQDPRDFRVHTITDPRTSELQYPWLRRFWLKLPNYGEISIFDTSWHRRLLVDRLEESISESEYQKAFNEINQFEHNLADDGMIILKFWLHISKKEQRKRMKEQDNNPNPFFRVTDREWHHHKHYDDYLILIEEMLERTQTEWAPWYIISAMDTYYTRLRVIETVINAIKSKLSERNKKLIDYRSIEEKF